MLLFNFCFFGFALISSTCIHVHVERLKHRHDFVNEPRSEKTGFRGFRLGPTQTRLRSK